MQRSRVSPVPGTLLATAALLLAGCAGTPPSPDATRVTPVPAAAPRVAASPEGEGARFAAAEGYRRVEKRGQTLYCRPDALLGSKLNRDVCYTEAQLETLSRNTQEFMRGIQGAIGPAGSAPTGPLER